MKPENLGNSKKEKNKTVEIGKNDAKTKPESCMYPCQLNGFYTICRYLMGFLVMQGGKCDI
jgi:hypothetical protein